MRRLLPGSGRRLPVLVYICISFCQQGKWNWAPNSPRAFGPAMPAKKTAEAAPNPGNRLKWDSTLNFAQAGYLPAYTSLKLWTNSWSLSVLAVSVVCFDFMA